MTTSPILAPIGPGAVRTRLLVLRARIAPWLERIFGITLLILGLAWMLWNFSDDPARFFASLLGGLTLGSMYALIALGYTMVYGIVELINFAHGDLFMLGTILSANIIVTGAGVHEMGIHAAPVILLALILTMVFCASLNVASEFFAYRRLRRAPKLAALMTAVGLSFVFRGIAQQEWINGSSQKSWFFLWHGASFRGIAPAKIVLVISVTVPLLIAMTWIVKRTRQGMAMRAVAQDQDGARLMGINVDRTISFTFGLGGALAGAAAVLWFCVQTQTYYNAGTQLGLIAFTAAVLGGIGNLTGAVVGGVTIGIIQGINEGCAHAAGLRWSQSVVFLVLILLLVLKPEGLLGRRSIEKV